MDTHIVSHVLNLLVLQLEMGTSVFSGVSQGAPVEIFKLIDRLKRDQFPNKVDLGGGSK